MKTIDSFDTALHYAVRLGFHNPKDCIAHQQEVICDVTDRLLQASGNTSWYHATFKPFQCRFHCHVDNGLRYPALGKFTVKTVNGDTIQVDA